MAEILDHIDLDDTNIEFNYALDFIRHTNKLVYLTGKAGTGKTTFLKYLHNTTSKKTVILAPTGVAAVNAGGQTINSFFQIKPSVYIPNDKRLRIKAESGDTDRSTIYDHFKYFKERIEIIRNLELLVIDEISMVRCDLLDVIDRLLRIFRNKRNEIFGGVQVVLIGDTFQLSPIAEFDQWEILQPFYKSSYFFSSKVIEQNKPIYIELKKIYRQNEQEFIDLLNRIRINQVSSNEFNLLNSKYDPTFSAKGLSNYITLATHSKIVESTNLTKLNELNTELHLFEATVIGIFPDNIMPTDRILQLKDGAQVMFVKNDKSKRFYNGKIGKIKTIENNRIIIEISEGNQVTVEKQAWSNVKYVWDEKAKKIDEEVIGTFNQYPLRLAWAITVHKSQGLTFENVIADLGAAFTSGQVYVALSRCTTFSGLVLKSKIEQKAIIVDPVVLKFAQNETPDTLILQELNSGKADFYYKKVREEVKLLDFLEAFSSFKKAIKFRNDIETELFKRIFTVTANRLVLYEKRYNESVLKSKEFLEEIQTNALTIKNLNELNHKNALKIDELNRGLKLVINESEQLNKKNVTLLNDKSIVESKLFNLQKQRKESQGKYLEAMGIIETKDNLLKEQLEKIQTLQSIIKADKRLLNDKKVLIQNLTVENTRLNKLKWYNKLFGQK